MTVDASSYASAGTISSPARPDVKNRWAVLLLALVLAAAVAHRIFLLIATDFPINDGGLFYAFSKAIAQTFPSLPATVSYNGLDLPLAYPPLSFWLAAFLTNAGVETLAIFHVAPILMNIIFVFLFALVLSRSGRSLMFVALATLFFCTQLRSFEWLIMGGGISRGLGSVFLMATLLAIGVPDGVQRRHLPIWRIAVAGAAVAGAILSHLEWGLNAAACVILSRALASPDFKGFVRDNLVAGIVALLLISPWLLTIYEMHGLEPFLAAGESSHWGVNTVADLVLKTLLSSAMNPLVPVGLVLLVRRRDYFWPAFVLLCMILTPRHALTPLTIPLSVFAAAGALWFFANLGRAGRAGKWAPAMVVLFIVVVVVGPFNSNYFGAGDAVHSLGRPQRDAMRWVAHNLPNTSFIVVGKKRAWQTDSSAEWFPVLAGARSTNTVQGREWVPGAYARYRADTILMKRAKSCSELKERLAAFDRPQFLWIEINQHCFPASRFPVVFRNEGVTIFRQVQDFGARKYADGNGARAG